MESGAPLLGAGILEPPFGQVVREASLGREHLTHAGSRRANSAKTGESSFQAENLASAKAPQQKKTGRDVRQQEAGKTDTQPGGVRVGRVQGVRGSPAPGRARSCQEGQESGCFSKDHGEPLEGF